MIQGLSHSMNVIQGLSHSMDYGCDTRFEL